jgi:WD40 repeat protein
MAANSHDKVVLFDVAFSADKKFVAACSKLGYLYIWNLDSYETSQTKPIRIFQISTKPLYSLHSFVNQLLIGGAEGVVAFSWESLIKSSRLPKPVWKASNTSRKWDNGLTTPGTEVNAMAVNDETACLYCATGDNVVTEWDLKTGKHKRIFEGHQDYLLDITLSQSMVTTAACDGLIKIWDTRTGECSVSLDTTTGKAAEGKTSKFAAYASCVDFHCDGNCILSGGSYGDQLLLWDLSQREIVKAMPMCSAPQVCVMNDDMTCYSGTNIDVVSFWSRNAMNHYEDQLLNTTIPSIWGLQTTDQCLVACGSAPQVEVFVKPFSSPRQLLV